MAYVPQALSLYLIAQAAGLYLIAQAVGLCWWGRAFSPWMYLLFARFCVGGFG